MNALFLKLLNMSAAGSILIVAVVILRAVLKKAPRWIICAMWALVAVRLVCPVTIASPVSVFRAAPAIVSESGEVEVFRSAGGSEKPLLAVDTVRIEQPQESSETIREIPGTSYAVTQRSHDAYLPPLVQAYLIGLAGMLLYAAISTLLLRRKVSVSLREQGNVHVCDSVTTPFILGIVRPAVYLPSSLNEEEKHFVLAHECAHLHRLDHIWKPLGFLILCVHWFNPLCWLAYVLLCRDIELACDERVIRELGRTERAAYSQTLLSCSTRHVLAACPVAFGETGVKSRVKAVLNYKKPAIWIIVATVLACLVLIGCFATMPLSKDTSKDTPADEAVQGDADVVRKVGAYAVVANDGAKAGTEAYPYMVKTEQSVWYLAEADMELQGEDAFFEGLAEVLQYFDEDVADAQKALAGRIPAEIPPVEIRTDFCGQAGVSESAGAYYNGMANFIKLFHSWEMVRYALLHEYVHYLTFHCAEKQTLSGFYGEAVAEYVSMILCENRMMRSVDPSTIYEPEMLDAMRAWGVWDEEIGNLDYRKSVLCKSDAYARGLYNGQQYMSVGQSVLLRMGDRPIPYHVDDLAYAEGESLALYLIETYGEDKFLDNWDTPSDKVPALYGLAEEELLTAWSTWNAIQCEKLGIRMELGTD